VLGSVDGDLGKIQSDDAVVAVKCFVDEAFEHAGVGPLVEPTAQRGL